MENVMTERLTKVTRMIAVSMWLLVGVVYMATPATASEVDCTDHCKACNSGCDWCGQMPDGFICYQKGAASVE